MRIIKSNIIYINSNFNKFINKYKYKGIKIYFYPILLMGIKLRFILMKFMLMYFYDQNFYLI